MTSRGVPPPGPIRSRACTHDFRPQDASRFCLMPVLAPLHMGHGRSCAAAIVPLGKQRPVPALKGMGPE